VDAAPPAASVPYGGDAAVADWRARQEAWRTQNDAWRRSQQDADRAARDQARRERHAHGTAFALEAEERRRIRRATRPRTSFVFVLTALGAGIVAGAIAVLTALMDAATAPFAGAIGFFTAALITALAMVVAGAIRRRSGFLTAVTIVMLVIGGSVATASGGDGLVMGSADLGTCSCEQQVTQPFGSLHMSVGSLSDAENIDAGAIVVTKGVGPTYIEVYPGTALDLEGALDDANVTYTTMPWRGGDVTGSGAVEPDSDGSVSWHVSNPNTGTEALTTQHITLDQRSGSVEITIYEK
jgi:hypothetical protein